MDYFKIWHTKTTVHSRSTAECGFHQIKYDHQICLLFLTLRAWFICIDSFVVGWDKIIELITDACGWSVHVGGQCLWVVSACGYEVMILMGGGGGGMGISWYLIFDILGGGCDIWFFKAWYLIFANAWYLIFDFLGGLTSDIWSRSTYLRVKINASIILVFVNKHTYPNLPWVTPPPPPWAFDSDGNEMKWWCFRPLLYILFRLNWAKQTPGIMRRN